MFSVSFEFPCCLKNSDTNKETSPLGSFCITLGENQRADAKDLKGETARGTTRLLRTEQGTKGGVMLR